MRATAKGQVTIPKSIRDVLGITAGSEVVLERVGDVVVIRRVPDDPRRGRHVVERLRGRGDVTMTTDETIALTRGPDGSR